MRFQWTWFLFALFFLLMFFLHGCAKTPDAATMALLEASDAVCLAEATGGSASYDQKTVMALTVREDYLGSISTLGQDAHRDDRVTVYVAVDHDWFIRVFKAWKEESGWYTLRLILFLDVYEEDYKDGKPLFVPHGGEGSIRRETRDGAGLRYLEALRAYGKQHPREAESWTYQYPEGLWTDAPSIVW